MAQVTPRKDKQGQISFYIRAYVGRNAQGKRLFKNTTWQPPKNMRPAAAEKEAQRQAVIFEESIKNSIAFVSSKTTFAEYAQQWLSTAEIKPKTKEQYTYVLERINAAIGHIPLEKLKPQHLKDFYKNLKENTAVENIKAVSSTLNDIRKSKSLTIAQLAKKANLSENTVGLACNSKKINKASAEKIATALNIDIKDIFVMSSAKSALSNRTIHLHHVVIRRCLNVAKKEQVLSYNVAELVDAPKQGKSKPKYYTKAQAQQFLAALLKYEDIRIQTVLMLDLFTGMRKGELCGLSWQDINFKEKTININRSSLYLLKKGITESDLKTDTSDRVIMVSDHVMAQLKKYKNWWNTNRLLWGEDWQGEKKRLFIQKDGKPLFPDTINYWLNKFLKDNNLPHISPHNLRHTFATLHFAAGTDPKALQNTLGHSQLSTMLNFYIHFLKEEEQKSVQNLDNILLG